VRQDVFIGDDEALPCMGAYPMTGGIIIGNLAISLPIRLSVMKKTTTPALAVTGGGLTFGCGSVVTGYFGDLAGTPPFNEMLYIGVRFGEEGTWNYG